MKKLLVLAALAAASGLGADVYVIAPSAPPADRVETPGVGPSGSVWVPGHWNWVNGAWAWDAGHWSTPPHSGATWIPGHWAPNNRGYVWVPGHWY